MPAQYKLSTDKGNLAFSEIIWDAQAGQRDLYLGGTDIPSVAGVPRPLLFENIPLITEDWPEDFKPPESARTLNLKNGNKITVYYYRDGRSDYIKLYMKFEYVPAGSGKQNGYIYKADLISASRFKELGSYIPPVCFTEMQIVGDPRKQIGLALYNPGIFETMSPEDVPTSIKPTSQLPEDVYYSFEGFQYPYQGYNSFPFWVDFSVGSEAPLFPGEDSGEDAEKNPGGDGDGPDGIEDDPIEIPEDPTISAANAGLLTLYTPTLSQIHNFGSYLWSDSFSLDTFKKLFSDPMEAVIGLSVVPVSVPSAGAQNIIIGVMDSGVSANRAASQYVTVDCGTIKVKPIWNTALDFEPYTKFSVFLPFIGTREISADDIMGKDVNIKYLVDVLSGACTAHIKVGGSVLYQFSGSCTTPIPISALNWSNLVTSSIGLLAGGTAAAATGGVAGGVALAAMTAGAVARSKPTIQRAGNVSGAAGMLGVKIPYLIRESPRQSLAKDYNKFVGYPSNITSKLSDLKGYTQVENVHLEGIPATGDELSEIESLLKEGVIL